MVLDRWPRRSTGPAQWQISGDVPQILELERPAHLAPGRHVLDAVVDGDLAVLTLDGVVTLNTPLYDHSCGRLGLFVSDGRLEVVEVNLTQRPLNRTLARRSAPLMKTFALPSRQEAARTLRHRRDALRGQARPDGRAEKLLKDIGLYTTYRPSALGYQRFDDGSLYMLPFEYGAEYFWYNKALFAKAGIAIPTSLDDFPAMCTALAKAGRRRSPWLARSSGRWSASWPTSPSAWRVRTMSPS